MWDPLKNVLALIGLVFSVAVAVMTLWRAFHGRLKVRARATYISLTDKLFKAMQPTSLPEPFEFWSSPCLYELEIVNRGKVEVKDLILSLPWNGIFITSRPGTEEKEFDQQIELGALRPKSQLRVKIWIKDAYSSELREVCLTHAGVGEIPIRLGEIAYSTLAKGIESFGEPTRFTLGVLLIFGCVMSLTSLLLQVSSLAHNSKNTGQSAATTHPTSDH